MLYSTLDREYDIFSNPANMVRAFRAMDISASGHLSRADFDAGLTRLGLWVSSAERAILVEEIDSGHDQLISIEDIVEFQSRSLVEQVPNSIPIKNENFQDINSNGRSNHGDDDNDDDNDKYTGEVSLSKIMKRRRVAGTVGQQLQRRFRDYAVADAFLLALEGLSLDGDGGANSLSNHGGSGTRSGDADEKGVCLLPEEMALVLQCAQCHVTAPELRWLGRTFSSSASVTAALGQEEPVSVDAGALISFSLGARDPWVRSSEEDLSDHFMRVTPEEETPYSKAKLVPLSSPASRRQVHSPRVYPRTEEVYDSARVPMRNTVWHARPTGDCDFDDSGAEDEEKDDDEYYSRDPIQRSNRRISDDAEAVSSEKIHTNEEKVKNDESDAAVPPFGTFEWILHVTSVAPRQHAHTAPATSHAGSRRSGEATFHDREVSEGDERGAGGGGKGLRRGRGRKQCSKKTQDHRCGHNGRTTNSIPLSKECRVQSSCHLNKKRYFEGSSPDS